MPKAYTRMQLATSHQLQRMEFREVVCFLLVCLSLYLSLFKLSKHDEKARKKKKKNYSEHLTDRAMCMGPNLVFDFFFFKIGSNIL